jgi:hypothetical protein
MGRTAHLLREARGIRSRIRMRQVKALAAGAVLALAVTAPANSASRAASGASAPAWPGGEASIGYASDAALRARWGGSADLAVAVSAPASFRVS